MKFVYKYLYDKLEEITGGAGTFSIIAWAEIPFLTIPYSTIQNEVVVGTIRFAFAVSGSIVSAFFIFKMKEYLNRNKKGSHDKQGD